MMRSLSLAVVALALMAQAPAGTEPAAVPLWPSGPPGIDPHRDAPEIVENSYIRNIHRPSLTVFRADPAHANGAAMIVIPGGGHRMLVWVNEGVMPARALNRFGITVFVLKYRLAREAGSTFQIERDAVADARRAVRFVRAHAADYGVDPHRIGLMGFSAGGELVSHVADAPTPPVAADADGIDRTDARPDFQVLIYPGPLGIPAPAANGAPPAFLAAGTLDACCAEPSITLYQRGARLRRTPPVRRHRSRLQRRDALRARVVAPLARPARRLAERWRLAGARRRQARDVEQYDAIA